MDNQEINSQDQPNPTTYGPEQINTTYNQAPPPPPVMPGTTYPPKPSILKKMPFWAWFASGVVLFILIAILIMAVGGVFKGGSGRSSNAVSSSAIAECPSGDWTDNKIKIKSISDVSGCMKTYDEAFLNSDDTFKDSIFTFDFFKMVKGGSWADVYKVYYDTEDTTSAIEFELGSVNRSGYSYWQSTPQKDADTPTAVTARSETKKNIEEYDLKYVIDSLGYKVSDSSKTKKQYIVDRDDLKIVSLINDSGTEYHKATTYAYYEIYGIVYKENTTDKSYSNYSFYNHLSIHVQQLPNDMFKSEKSKIEDFATNIASKFKKRTAVINKL